MREDIQKLRELRNKNAVFFIYSEYISENDQEVWYSNYLNKRFDIMFKISLMDDPKGFIGAVALYEINPERKTAEFGRIVIDKEQTAQKGLGYDATVCACKIGFEQLGLDRIVLEVFSDNMSAVKTYNKAGFKTYEANGNILKMELNKTDLIINEN